MRGSGHSIFFLAGLLAVFAAAVAAAERSAVFGSVQASGGYILRDVDVQVQSDVTGARWRTTRMRVAGIQLQD